MSEVVEPQGHSQGAPTQQTPAVIAERPPVMQQNEVVAVQAMIQSYSNYPGVSQAFATMVSEHSHNAEQLTAVVRAMVDEIEQVRANPHASRPVHPSIAAAVEAIRKAELEKPDPLNLLRPEQQPQAEAQAPAPHPFAGLIDKDLRNTIRSFAGGQQVQQYGGEQLGVQFANQTQQRPEDGVGGPP